MSVRAVIFLYASLKDVMVRKDTYVYWHYYTDSSNAPMKTAQVNIYLCVGCVWYTEKEESCLVSLVLR